ncbi:MAG: hypothetical protein L6Q78_13215 [Bacteroidia bacterium]|nr:hypothetical protein [Bacteroidia bacterium]
MDFRKHLSNIPGWRTNRKLVIFESDDWGSIRTRSKFDFNSMLEKGVNVDNSNFTRFDCLESDYDLERLYNLLSKFKDRGGNHPVFTPMCVVANPDFEKISNAGFSDYFFESFEETCKRYPNSNKVVELWNKGVKENLFVPEFHGREHLNALRWMRALQEKNPGVLTSFEHQSIGGSKFKGEPIPEYLAAFDPQFEEDIEKFKQVLISGAEIFYKVLGYKPRHFVASNKPEPKELEETLSQIGVKYLIRYKLQQYPKGNGKTTKELNWLGRKNTHGQIVLTRNSGFEPSDISETDWVSTCLNDLATSFFWSKPAVISTHRVNYVSGIDQKNADSGLFALEKLLTEILRNWPDVEFVTSSSLGAIIMGEMQK